MVVRDCVGPLWAGTLGTEPGSASKGTPSFAINRLRLIRHRRTASEATGEHLRGGEEDGPTLVRPGVGCWRRLHQCDATGSLQAERCRDGRRQGSGLQLDEPPAEAGSLPTPSPDRTAADGIAADGLENLDARADADRRHYRVQQYGGPVLRSPGVRMRLNWFWGFLGFLGVLGFALDEPWWYGFFAFFMFFLQPVTRGQRRQ